MYSGGCAHEFQDTSPDSEGFMVQQCRNCPTGRRKPIVD